MGLLDYIVVLFNFLRNLPILLSIMAAPMYIPINSVQRFLFLHILTSTCYCLSFWWPFASLLWQNNSLGPLPFSQWDYLFFSCWVVWVPHIFRISTSCHRYYWQICSLHSSLGEPWALIKPCKFLGIVNDPFILKHQERLRELMGSPNLKFLNLLKFLDFRGLRSCWRFAVPTLEITNSLHVTVTGSHCVSVTASYGSLVLSCY